METCRQPSRPPIPTAPTSLPPPPPPPPSHVGAIPHLPFCPHGPYTPRTSRQTANTIPWWKAWLRKYVVLCLVSGGLLVLLGIIFIGIYFTLRTYTSSLQFFETIPTYVPAVVLIITGLMVMCFAKRRNRYAYLIKLAGGCSLICALLCVVITVTTTVIHMNRLQTLHKCVYTPKAKTCTCVSAIADPGTSSESHRFVFNNTPNCDVVHGSLSTSLRVLFGLSVVGILICIFSAMLVYQLLSHEKKKLYWEQLELRRRFIYARHTNHPVCSCYEDMYPWPLWEMLDYRFLSAHHFNSGPLTEEESPSQATRILENSGQGQSSSQRNSSWSWLPWPWHGAAERMLHTRGSVSNMRNSFMRRLISREIWREDTTSPSTSTPHESPLRPDSPQTSPWRTNTGHIFHPNVRTAAGQQRFGARSRPTGSTRPLVTHRRTRSNDGVFHHLQMNSSARYSPSFVPAESYEIPRHMWGPPPPYSHPPSTENVSGLQTGLGNTGQHCFLPGRETINLNSTVVTVESQVHEPETNGAASSSSKMSTPLSERRLMCHFSSSDGITLTISNNLLNICNQSDDCELDEDKRDNSCIVEMDVPYIVQKEDIMFNTLPTRSSKKKDLNPFKSLSNIPLCLSKKLNEMNLEKHCSGNLAFIESCCKVEDVLHYSVEDFSKFQEIENTICDKLTYKTFSERHLYDEDSQHISTDSSPTSLSFQATFVELPSDFKSSVMIATSPSTPVTENVTLTDKMYAQSMPNLSISNSPTAADIFFQVPSSGNTSTSQDFADFDLDEESSPLDFDSPSSDATSAPSLPEDEQHFYGSNHLLCNHPKIPKNEHNFDCDESQLPTKMRCNLPCPPTFTASGRILTADKSQTSMKEITEQQGCLSCPESEAVSENRGFLNHGLVEPKYLSTAFRSSQTFPSSSEGGCYASDNIPALLTVSPRDRTESFVVTIKSVNV
ncbi:uncharacterized protein LOC143232729 isoform X1 [Tachypleus tridentatus]|uniref:uncharacterized protein LOC143232729 isoform X1 n=2 Tax=Tachypleus tridentatus TaxID=6853 RepID=UPI003FD30A4E